jgi:hypothetical protein
MIRYKNIFWTLILALPLLTGISGCKKFLDRKPLGTGTEDDISQGGLEGKVFGLYGGLRNEGMSGFNVLTLKSFRSDDAIKGSIPTDQSEATAIFDNFDYSKDFWLVNGYWDGHYEFITLCNNVIHEIDSLNLTDAPSLTNRAEATFMRAYAYFDLVRDFGAVPKIDFKVYTPAEANVAKSTVEQIYALIDADLQFAVAHLPWTWEPKFIGRATLGAAKTLQAKTLLYRENWAGALAASEDVINSTNYALVTPYYKFFHEEGENSSESIFEVQMYENANGSVYFGNNYNQVQGVRGSGDWDLGWGFNCPTQSLVDSYEPNDPRRASTILFSGQGDDPANGGYGRQVPPSPPLAQPYWNKKVYTSFERQQQTGYRFSWWLNIRILRYADVLLMAAEAANELGGAANITKALGYVEQIRERARNGNSSILPPLSASITQAALRDAIRRERRAEFGMEWERFYDLVRWDEGDPTSTIRATPVLGPLGYEYKNRYYPLPQPAIDKSGGKLVQNPDYP